MEKIELPDDLLQLQDLIDKLMEQYENKLKYSPDDRAWIRYNYTEATRKYNRLSGRTCYVTNIYSIKKNDLK